MSSTFGGPYSGGSRTPYFRGPKPWSVQKGHSNAGGLEREHWSTARPIRDIFRDAFERVDLPYFNPHSFRHTLADLGQRLCKTPEELKAWSQNLGHERMLTTWTSYGTVAATRQAELIRNLAQCNRPFPISTG